MADIIVKNSLNSSMAAKFTVSLQESAIKNDKGDFGANRWLIVVGTTHLDKLGNILPPKIVYNVLQEDIDSSITAAIATLCKNIDWGTLDYDNNAPFIISTAPTGDAVSISSDLIIKLSDSLPSSGLDLSNMTVELDNGSTIFDITNDVSIIGDDFNCELYWSPSFRVMEAY